MKYILFPLILIITLSSCENNTQNHDFYSWYKEKYPNHRFIIAETNIPENKTEQFTIHSSDLEIDSIYRSMQGPYDLKTFSFDNSTESELIWLTGYSAEINESSSGKKLPDGLLCHNNLNIANKDQLPWKVKTKASKTRLFTLTEGQTEVKLPQGFGMPFPSGYKAEVVSQVLNHNNPEMAIITNHHVKINYIPQGKLEQPLIPLYQQAVFITKQTSGPKGTYGAPPVEQVTNDTVTKVENDHPSCGPPINISDYNPYEDEYGRTYTGHWKLPYEREVLRTEVTAMLHLNRDTRVHYIGVHLHPFAEYLSLRDITADTTLFRANVYNYQDKIGIKKIDHYSSEKGIKLHKDHRYELISSYNCSDSSNVHTAMATMFLYLRYPGSLPDS